jgi:hypothetical protein
MALDLSSVEAKLERAATHFESIERIAVSWVNKHLYRLVHERNADFTRHELIYRCTEELNFETLSLMFGDAIHNLRSALDHLIYAIAVHKASGATPPPDWRIIAFPITDCPTGKGSFKNFCAAKLGTFAPDTKLLEVLEDFQPYRRKNKVFPPLLKVLRDFDDADKHRLLHLAFIQGVQWEYEGTFGNVPPKPFQSDSFLMMGKL